MYRVLFLSLLTVGAQAQISDLATTGDGREVYFTSPFRPVGSTYGSLLKIFHYSDQHLEIFRVLNPQPQFPDTDYYSAIRPSVSAEGSVVAYTAGRDCLGGSRCSQFQYFEGRIANPDGSDRLLTSGMVTLSPDGRYAISFKYQGEPGNHPSFFDLSQNIATYYMGAYRVIGDGRQNIANNGAVLLSPGITTDVGLWKDGTFQKLSLPVFPAQARLDALAQTIVYESANELHSFSVASGQDVLLRKAASTAVPPPDYRAAGAYYAPSLFRPSISSDGRLVTYILDGQLWIQPTDGLDARQLTSAPEGIADAVLSGSGAIAYAATQFSRLLRIEIASGTVAEMLPAVPALSIGWGAFAPGARLDVAVSGAPDGADPQLLVSNAPPAPVVARSPGMVTFQVPWEAAVGSQVELRIANPSPLEQPPLVNLRILASSPTLFTRTDFRTEVIAAHDDFSGLVTDDKPALPGELIHVYFTGLGAVSPSLPTGMPTPTDVLYRSLAPLSCEFVWSADPRLTASAEILFAGLAPTFIGVYQVDLRIPQNVNSRDLLCVTDPNTLGTTAVVPVRLPQPANPGV